MTTGSGTSGRARPTSALLTGSSAGSARLGVPFTYGNAVDVLRNGNETLPALLAAIRGAQRSIDLLWYYWRPGDVASSSPLPSPGAPVPVPGCG